MDEVIINSLIGFVDKKQIFELFSKVVVTFTHLNPKEVKGICLEMVNSEEIFEEFITSCVLIEKGRFKLKAEAKPF
jgi:hypothetical protein